MKRLFKSAGGQTKNHFWGQFGGPAWQMISSFGWKRQVLFMFFSDRLDPEGKSS
jgi:hypothetical protein